MSHTSQEHSLTLQVQTQFVNEIQAVEEKLALAFEGLYAPLLGLVRAQIYQAKPYLRAAVVLVTAIKADESVDIRDKRIYLASALEMLYIALNVHQLLLDNNEQIEDTIDKSVLGSTILAGDYCFSHAASLAARTDNPQVVAIFSQTLQSVSENQLRLLFDNKAAPASLDGNSLPVNASTELFSAGIRSAEILAELDSASVNAHGQIVDSLNAQVLHNKIALPIDAVALTPIQQKRWKAFVNWRNQSTPAA